MSLHLIPYGLSDELVLILNFSENVSCIFYEVEIFTMFGIAGISFPMYIFVLLNVIFDFLANAKSLELAKIPNLTAQASNRSTHLNSLREKLRISADSSLIRQK